MIALPRRLTLIVSRVRSELAEIRAAYQQGIRQITEAREHWIRAQQLEAELAEARATIAALRAELGQRARPPGVDRLFAQIKETLNPPPPAEVAQQLDQEEAAIVRCPRGPDGYPVLPEPEPGPDGPGAITNRA